MGLKHVIDITTDQREAIVSLLSHHLPNAEVWVYGSRAKGTSRPESDLDMVVFTSPEQAHAVSDLREAFEESDLPFRVDLFVWDELPKSFREAIKREHAPFASDPISAKSGVWRNSCWGDLATLEYGRSLQGYRDCGGQYRVFGTNGPIGRCSEALCEDASVIVGRKGAYRGVHYSADPFSVIDTAFYLKPKVELDVRWAYYSLLTQDINSMDSGSAIPSTSREDFYRLPVSVPPIAEQHAIAFILAALDDKIDLNRRMNETLEAMARAIFTDWFVDFGPTRAKAEGRAPYLAPELWELFPDALDDEGKPVGWEFSEIGKEVRALGGGTPSTKEQSYWEGGKHHWATPKDLSKLTSPVLIHTDRRITDAGVNKISSGLLPIGTVLLSSRAPIGYLAIAEVPTSVNQGFIAMVCEGRLPNTFVLFWCHENLDYIKDISGGSTFAEISKRAFRPIPVLVPSEHILAAYDRLIRPLYLRVVANVKENETLVRLRDLLLPKLMSGELRLGNAEVTLEPLT